MINIYSYSLYWVDLIDVDKNGTKNRNALNYVVYIKYNETY